MSTPLAQLARIAVFRALHLGDLLCAVPALRALRAAAPNAHIALIGLPWAQALVQRLPQLVDELIEYPCSEALPDPEDADPAFRAFLDAARRRDFELAIQMHGSGERSNALLRALGARRQLGYCRGRAEPDAGFLPWRPRDNEVLRWLRLLASAGIEERGRHLEFPLFERDRAAAAALRLRRGLPARGYVCLHAGARLPSRRWPVSRFAEVAQALLRFGSPVVLTGSAGERELAAAIRARVTPVRGVPLVDLCGHTDLGSLAALLAEAALLVCNDTGVSHLAAALDVRSVVVSCGGDAQRWAPLDEGRHRVFAHEVACRPCLYERCPIGHPCALGTSSVQVVSAALAQGPAAPRSALEAFDV